MTDTAVASPVAAPVAEQQSSKLDDIMLAMDVVDTLRHEQDVISRELSSDARDAAFVGRVKQIYAGQGITVSEAKSGRFIMSGSWGNWPMLPAAKPAKPAPSCAIASRCVAGTTLALGAPFISTNEQRKNSMPFSATNDLT